jgi:hypothetical protein
VDQSTTANVWTPELAQDRLLEAVAWLRVCGGRAAPAGLKPSMPGYQASLEDHALEGWGLPECADPDQEQEQARRSYGPGEIDAMNAALDWVPRYVAPTNPRDAAVLQAWLVCRVYRRSFDKGLMRLQVSRATAYRMRDRALAMISRRLDRDGVAL